MLTRELAVTLRGAGLGWDPANGNRFVVPDRDLDDQVFVLSDMVIELLDAPGGDQVLAFNGTTEWALHSLETSDAIWVPREDQLRDLLGDAFVSLERLAGPPAGLSAAGRGAGRHADGATPSTGRMTSRRVSGRAAGGRA